MRHLVPKQMERHAINNDHVVFLPKSIETVLAGYTREAGVRNLDREIAAICRHAAVKVAESRDLVQSKRMDELADGLGMGSAMVASVDDSVDSLESGNATSEVNADEVEDAIPLVLDDTFKCLVVDEDVVKEVLGPVKYESELAQRTAVPGVATG